VHPVFLYLPGERLSQPELCAARLDGDVVELGEGYVPCDTVEGAAARATSLAPLIPSGAALCGRSAAWVHGAGDRPPAVHHVARIRSARARTRVCARVVHHDRQLPADDIQWLSGVCLTTPLATAVALLFGSARDDDDERWLRALFEVHPELPAGARERLSHLSRRPGARHARHMLERWWDQEVVTR